MKIKHIQEAHLDTQITLCGWVRTVRQQKSFSFIELNDGSTFSNMQIVVDQSLPDYESHLAKLSTGASICVTGVLVSSPGQKQKWELKAESLRVLGTCP